MIRYEMMEPNDIEYLAINREGKLVAITDNGNGTHIELKFFEKMLLLFK